MKTEDDSSSLCDIGLFNINDFDVLLHEILKQTRDILHSEAGSIYICEKEALCFNVFQNDLMSYENIYKHFYSLKDLKLPLSEGEKYLAVESFLSNKIIAIDDVYKADSYDFLGVKEFDKKFAYKTHSIITIPIVYPLENKKLGVLQLLNKKVDGELVSYDDKDKKMLSMISSFIALSIYKAQSDIEKLKKLNAQLEIANEKLQKRVDKEVRESEKKSAIIFHQSKLASLGEMIRNIAHQWRQPLNSISAAASGLSINIELGNCNNEDIKKGLRNIVTTTQHLSQTIDDFRNFYKLDKIQSDFNLAKNILSSISIIQAALLENQIVVHTNLDKDINLYGYENELKQAILNIIQNSKDAILEKIPLNKPRLIFINLKKTVNSILIEIKDNGNGISENIIKKVFNQNFTTKNRTGGSGIGLYMTKEIIEKHMKGDISIKNEKYVFNNQKYKGAVITIKFNLENSKTQ
ncbi:MAG: ATP-binding protein [Halarcobacter sp.]